MMFFGYAMLGAAVFILLGRAVAQAYGRDKAVIALWCSTPCCATVYIAGASMWPQFDPEDEKGKIDKILKPKWLRLEQGKAEELIARAKALDRAGRKP